MLSFGRYYNPVKSILSEGGCWMLVALLFKSIPSVDDYAAGDIYAAGNFYAGCLIDAKS